jgi:hypothetical protein
MDEDPREDVTPATQKDHSEVQQKKEEYGEFMTWGPERGILKDLADMFQIENPPLKFLVPIAQCVSRLIDVELDRQDKRRRELLIGWFNKNYERIQPLLGGLILLDDTGRGTGPRAKDFEKFSAADPNHEVLLYLNEEKGTA